MPTAEKKSPGSRRKITVRDFRWYRDHCEGVELRGERDFVARCPSHADGRPSLHVWEDGRGLQVYCFAGCTWDEVDAALDGAPVRPAVPKVFCRRERGEVVARYEYRNEDGEVVYRKLRYEPKSFSFARRVVLPARTEGPVKLPERVTWRQGLKDESGNYVVEPIPYHLPELLAAHEVWIVDGEKDADRLAAEGLVATCSPYGMGRWRPEWSALLKDKDVVIVADRDEPGYRAADAVWESVHKFAASETLCEAAEGKDISDHLDAGYDIAEVRGVE